MAYLKEIWSRCDSPACAKKALVTLHTWRNELIGQYCRSHGNIRLRYQKDVEESVMAKEREVMRSGHA